ncbi:unnamed protein product, partial [Mesorhabditis spiculigera]
METRDFVPSLGITERQVCAYATISAVVLLLPQAHFVWQQAVLLLVRSNRSYDLLLLLLGCFGFIQLILHSIGLVVSLTSDVLADWMLLLPPALLISIFLLFCQLILPYWTGGNGGTILTHFLFILCSASFGLTNLHRLFTGKPKPLLSAPAHVVADGVPPVEATPVVVSGQVGAVAVQSIVSKTVPSRPVSAVSSISDTNPASSLSRQQKSFFRSLTQKLITKL